MSDASSLATPHTPQLGLLDKTITFASWALAGAIFLTIGWFAMEPDDPLGAVSLLTRHGAIVMLVQAAALAGVAAAVATALAGRLLADVGTFAAALGLAAVSLRGGTAETLLVSYSDLSPTYQRGLAAELALESVAWLVVMVVALVISALVVHWCFHKTEESGDERKQMRAALAHALAGRDLPSIGARLFGVPDVEPTAPREGVKHTLVAAGLGLAAIGLLSDGLGSRSIQHGQACFVVAAGVCIACYFAHRIMPVRSALWSILAVGIIAVVAYLWASIRPLESGLPAIIPSSHFLRVLPIQYVSIGTAAAVAMFWYVYTPAPDTTGRGQSRDGKSSKGGRR
jgi:hypothetical protein